MTITGHTSFNYSIHTDEQILLVTYNKRNVTCVCLQSKSKTSSLHTQQRSEQQRLCHTNCWICKGQHVLLGPRGAVNNTAKQTRELVVAKRHDPTFPFFLTLSVWQQFSTHWAVFTQTDECQCQGSGGSTRWAQGELWGFHFQGQLAIKWHYLQHQTAPPEVDSAPFQHDFLLTKRSGEVLCSSNSGPPVGWGALTTAAE